MAKVIRKALSKKGVVTPKGYALWVKIGKRIDEYEGRKKLVVNMYFDDETEKKMVKLCDKYLDEAKESDEFQGKNWRPANDRSGYVMQKVKINGEEKEKAVFKFWTSATVTDKDTGNERKKVVPLYSVEQNKTLNPYDIEIGNESEIRVSFFPEAYWMTRESNGISLYLGKVVVDKLVQYESGGFDEFGIESKGNTNGFDGDEEVPF